jgi:EAL domain-containing protein (putative c-di-GMP-specific phosphodiesterase class I)
MTRILDEATAGKGLIPTFQPVVSLPSRQIVGYEALARWPAFDNLTPMEVLGHAQETDQLSVLDQACIRSAVQGALGGSSTPGMLLLINSEPTATHADLGGDRDFLRAANLFRLSFEFTERGLLVNPGALLRKVDALRSLGCFIALDDVGANPDSLVLLDIVRPDIIKLDMTLVQDEPDRRQTRTIASILAHQERTGGVICAEGIENEDHLERAMAFGSTLGQGNLFGVPGSLAPIADVAPWLEPPPAYLPADARPSVSRLGKIEAPARTIRGQTLDGFVKHIQDSALTAECTPIVMAALGESRRHDQSVIAAYSRLAETSPLVALYGSGRPPDLSPRVRWVDIGDCDQLTDAAFVVALGPDTTAGLTAYRLDEEQFAMRLTFDRNVVKHTVTELLGRLP